jgi:hypothetical protein
VSEGPGGPGLPDDRVLAPTRLVAAFIVPVLVSAFVILYGFPGQTRSLWAWTISPELTPMFMGAGYLSGAYFFARAATTPAWHRVAVGFLGAVPFTATLLGATILHWDRFNHDHLSFWAWLSLYVSTPLLLPLLWVANQRRDPGVPEVGDVVVPHRLRLAVGGTGIVMLLWAAVVFAWPDVADRAWPWPLTDLTARTVSGFVVFPGVVLAWFLLDDRWSTFRIPVETAILDLALVVTCALRRWDELDPSDVTRWSYLAGLVVAFAAMCALHGAMERRRPRVVVEAVPVERGER